MRIPAVRGTIKRRLLVNYRANPGIVQNLLPAPFRPKIHNGYAIVGICLIRLEHIRPMGFPAILGIASENAAHRIAVEWTDNQGKQSEGVFIPRRDTESWVNRLVGGRVFPGEHHPAKFLIADDGHQIELQMKSLDQKVAVRVIGSNNESLPGCSCFSSLSEASNYFESGSLGYSVTTDPNRMDGLQLKTLQWRVSALEVSMVNSSYFEDKALFPDGSVQFDHALIMRDIQHEWHQAEDIYGSVKTS